MQRLRELGKVVLCDSSHVWLPILHAWWGIRSGELHQQTLQKCQSLNAEPAEISALN